jgi:BMFP domain-containing protein YqiC
VIAQEVQPLFPDIVGENTPIGETDPRLTVGYSTFGTIACKALQEFKIQTDEDLGAIEANIETVEQKLTEQLIEKEARISQLEARLAALEKLLPSAQ